MAIISDTINVAAAGTRTQATHKGNVKSIVFKARQTNTGNIYLGGSAVSSTSGITLAPGDVITIQLPSAISTAQFWADAETNANKVDYIGTD